jgi:hypothetical protein
MIDTVKNNYVVVLHNLLVIPPSPTYTVITVFTSFGEVQFES